MVWADMDSFDVFKDKITYKTGLTYWGAWLVGWRHGHAFRSGWPFISIISVRRILRGAWLFQLMQVQGS